MQALLISFSGLCISPDCFSLLKTGFKLGSPATDLRHSDGLLQCRVVDDRPVVRRLRAAALLQVEFKLATDGIQFYVFGPQ